MDSLTVLGIAIGFAAVVLGQHLEGGHLGMLINGPALVIVGGGTLGATMVQSPWPVFVRALQMLAWVIIPPFKRYHDALDDIVSWCRVARRDGLLGLEKSVTTITYPYARKALQMLVDGEEPGVIRDTLELDSYAREQRDLQAARVIDGMGGYAPTLGILGAIIGLIHVMHNLTDPSMLGEGIGVAFVATIYGVGFANLVFIPIANKLKAYIRDETRLQELIKAGVVAIAEGDNPRAIEARLQSLSS